MKRLRGCHGRTCAVGMYYGCPVFVKNLQESSQNSVTEI